ncbi:MAG: hypothetical protein KDB69_09215 [Acidimicrobiia bacterium]|nr:hypothetical protein [Acidimicrobiia bacterium]
MVSEVDEVVGSFDAPPASVRRLVVVKSPDGDVEDPLLGETSVEQADTASTSAARNGAIRLLLPIPVL